MKCDFMHITYLFDFRKLHDVLSVELAETRAFVVCNISGGTKV